MSSRTRWKLFSILILVVLGLGGAGSYFVFYRNTGPQTVTITPYVTTVAGTGVTVTFSVTTVTVVNTTASARSLSNLSLVSYTVFSGMFFDYNGNRRQKNNSPSIVDETVAHGGANRAIVNLIEIHRIK
jgi:hypothetical protein